MSATETTDHVDPLTQEEALVWLDSMSNHLSNAAYMLRHPDTYDEPGKAASVGATLARLARMQIDDHLDQIIEMLKATAAEQAKVTEQAS